ncbi:hypothetical protein, partial [Bradyrhizobium sp. JYMT SZCCT0428]|uniref:hypothetical protein n=1 Tax=Bradyrhizobium sp. JYMT SZCCT0428 TaxID=2807673 RepID=UPI001BAADB9E
ARVHFVLCKPHARPRVQRAPGLPCALVFEGKEFLAKLGRNASRECESMSAVIASEAKQSMAPRKERMDCFVASLLAMTERAV